MGTALRNTVGGLIAAAAIVIGPSATGGRAAAHGAAPAVPPRLSDTGLYAKHGALEVDPRNRPYSPQYPLWSDGAKKERWVYLPSGAPIDITNLDAWVFPIGTKFWKQFVFNGRRVETRLLWRASDQGWVFASYRWNDEQTDALLVPPDGDIGVAEIGPGRRHSIPSRDECRACHDSARTEILGFTALQLSTDRDPNAIHGEPLSGGMATLRTLMDQGVLAPRRTDLLADPPRIGAGSPRARAVLGYLSTNCGACHNQEGDLASLGMLLKQPARPSSAESLAGPHAHNAALGTTVGRASTWQMPGVPDGATLRITPGAPDLSALLYRMKSRKPSSQMPALGTVMPDREAIEAVGEWIAEMK